MSAEIEVQGLYHNFGKKNVLDGIELKIENAEAVIKAVREAGFEDDQVVMSATELDWLVDVRNYSKEMFLHWIFAQEEGLQQFAALGNAGISWNYPNCRECPKEKIDLAHQLGLKVCLRAGDNVEDVRYMQEIGLDYIPSNCMHE